MNLVDFKEYNKDRTICINPDQVVWVRQFGSFTRICCVVDVIDVQGSFETVVHLLSIA